MLAVDPAAARPAAFAPPELVAAQAALAAQLRAYGSASGATYDELTRSGSTGDTRSATAELGEQILDRAAARLAEVLEAFIATPARPARSASG